MYNIKLLNNISNVINSILTSDRYCVSADIDEPDAILVRSANMHEMQLSANISCIARAGAGVNNIPLDKCSAQGIVVFNTPGANANAVKELALAALLLSSRKIHDGISWTKTLIDKGDEIPKLVEKGKANFTGPEIKGKKLGVIGLGAIGVLVANDAKAIGMDVTGYDPYISVDAAWNLSRAVKHAVSLDEIYAESDYITVHVPLLPETKYMINRDTLAKMKDGVRIINLSRGELISNTDMLEALKNGKVSCYVTDFPDKDLIGAENVIAIPHLGASTPESEENCASMAAEQVKLFLETGNIVNSVNFPRCEMPKTNKLRIIIAHMNVPNMVGQITSCLASHNINIDNMINKSRDQLAYTMIDTDNDAPEDIALKISSIDGVIKVRTIR